MKKILQEFLKDKLRLVLLAASVVSAGLVSAAVGFSMGPDGNEYVAAGYQLLQPDVYGKASDYFPPLYPLLARGLFALNNVFVAKLFHHFLPALLVPLLIYSALKPFHRLAAFGAALLMTLDFNAMFYFSVVSTEGLYILALSVALFTFSRVLQNPEKHSWLYGHGFSIFLLMTIRAAGRYAFVFLLPFYIFTLRSWKKVGHLLAAFLLPTVIYQAVLQQLPYQKFPNALVPLTFARVNQLVDYDRDEGFRKLIDETEELYFTQKLSSSAKQQLIEDFEGASYVYASIIWIDMGWAGYSQKFQDALDLTFRDMMRQLTPAQCYRALKYVVANFCNYFQFHLLVDIYTLLPGPVKNSNDKHDIEAKWDIYRQRYGGEVSPFYKKYYYDKYTRIHYDLLSHDTRNANAIALMKAVNSKFILFFTFFVYFLAMGLLALHYRQFPNYFLVSLFGMVVLLYNFAVIGLFGVHERYRAPMDLFFFIPVGWLYAQLMVEGSWAKWKKGVVGGLVIVCVVLNTLEIDTIFKGLRVIRQFLHLP